MIRSIAENAQQVGLSLLFFVAVSRWLNEQLVNLGFTDVLSDVRHRFATIDGFWSRRAMATCGHKST